MSVDEIDKTELPLKAAPEIMSLLIKAKHFFNHATLHSQSENNFDTMISIHSLDNSIEYLLRIVIKHLEIEEKFSKTINTAELMGLFGEVDKFLKECTLFEGKAAGLPYENEIRQLRGLRNNVQHGMILPVNELRDIIKYGDKFFEKVLAKIFGITIQEIAYSSLIENENIKKYISAAEREISSGGYLDAIVSCRDAFEFGQFIFQNSARRLNKMFAIPKVKKDSMELYYYIQSIDEEISILGTNINITDYRRFKKYVDHIPSQYRADKSGYAVMQREWEKLDAEFCYSFVAQSILSWQVNQDRPLYEIDVSKLPSYKRECTISGVTLPDIYPEKGCMYMGDNDCVGELLYINEETKRELQKINMGDICKFSMRMSNAKNGALFKGYHSFVIVDTLDISLVLNSEPLWELILYYREVPFTNVDLYEDTIDVDVGLEFSLKDEEEQARSVILNSIKEVGIIDSIDKAFRLKHMLISGAVNFGIRERLYSSKLIALLSDDN